MKAKTLKQFLINKLESLEKEYTSLMNSNRINEALKVIDQINIISDIENDKIQSNRKENIIMENKIKQVLKDNLPESFNIIVENRKNCFGGEYIKIAFSPNTHNINDVRGQYPQCVSLCYDIESKALYPQIYGGNGGQCIYREINPEIEAEKYLCMKSIKIPFRKPKAEEKSVLKAIEKFTKRYIEVMQANKDQLRYKDIVNYSFLA